MSQLDLNVGDKVRYYRGTKQTLIGKVGTIKTIFASNGHGFREAMVEFEDGHAYPCWCGNLEKV